VNDKPYPYNEDQLAWLHDLETTEERQAKRVLHRRAAYGNSSAGFCCLGRACEVLRIDRDEHISGNLVTYDNEVIEAPKKVIDRLRLYGSCGHLIKSSTDGFYTLAGMNDDGKSFKEIAAYIRANPWNVFRDPEGEVGDAS
jgi:hypothetical protein